jgi:hypothetical protein
MIEHSDELLSLVANRKERARLDELVQQWAAEVQIEDQFGGNLWAAMTLHAVQHRAEAFPKFCAALKTRKNQNAKTKGDQMANSVSSGIHEDWGETPVELRSKEAKEHLQQAKAKSRKAIKAELR